jgi:hypothetical protein
MTMDLIEVIRHAARIENGRKVIDATFGKVAHNPHALLRLRQAARATDMDLLKLAAWVAGDGDALEMYERMGGTFSKEAIGAPMFQAPSMHAPQPQQPGAQAPSMHQALKVKPPQQPQVPQQPKMQIQTPGQGGASGQ